MTKEQLKTLGTLPKVIAALRALAAEMDVAQGLMQRVGLLTGSPGHSLPAVAPIIPPVGAAAVSPVAVQLDTPERREYERAKRLPAAQRKAMEDGFLAEIEGEREAKLSQMASADPDAPAPAPVRLELTTLSNGAGSGLDWADDGEEVN